jgi:hypothetical protein
VAIALWVGASPFVAYGLAVVACTAITTTRPAQFSMLPALARDAQQLAAANVVAGWAESTGVVLAALIAALFLGLGQIGVLFAVCAGFVAAAAILVAPVRPTSRPARTRYSKGSGRWPLIPAPGSWSAC